MAQSILLVYVPMDSLGDHQEYWERYTQYYEKYWGGPTSPLGVWFGNEYNQFRKRLSDHLGIAEPDISDCYFMKSDGRVFICPLVATDAPYILTAENFIPTEWFLMFEDDERRSLSSHWGFGALFYSASIEQAHGRLKSAEGILTGFIDTYHDSPPKGEIFERMLDLKPRVTELDKWLSQYHPSGFIVLNYGELASLFHPYVLRDERSVKEIWGILGHMESGELDKAEEGLVQLMQKWAAIRFKTLGEDKESTLQ